MISHLQNEDIGYVSRQWKPHSVGVKSAETFKFEKARSATAEFVALSDKASSPSSGGCVSHRRSGPDLSYVSIHTDVTL